MIYIDLCFQNWKFETRGTTSEGQRFVQQTVRQKRCFRVSTMSLLTFQEFIQQVGTKKQQVQKENAFDLLNKAILTCKNKHRALHGLTPESEERVQNIYDACMILAALGEMPNETIVREYLRELESLGLPVLWSNLHETEGPSNAIYDHATLRDMYRDYLDSYFYSQKEKKALERYLNNS